MPAGWLCRLSQPTSLAHHSAQGRPGRQIRAGPSTSMSPRSQQLLHHMTSYCYAHGIAVHSGPDVTCQQVSGCHASCNSDSRGDRGLRPMQILCSYDTAVLQAGCNTNTMRTKKWQVTCTPLTCCPQPRTTPARTAFTPSPINMYATIGTTR